MTRAIRAAKYGHNGYLYGGMGCGQIPSLQRTVTNTLLADAAKERVWDQCHTTFPSEKVVLPDSTTTGGEATGTGAIRAAKYGHNGYLYGGMGCGQNTLVVL